MISDAALKYAAAGWRVLPCARGGKLPLVAHGCKDASSDLAIVRAWWRQHPGANVAFATGAGVLVVDIDGEQGETSWLTVQMRAGRRLRDTLSVRTGSGGRHLYLRTSGELGNTVGKLGPGIDTRCGGGYVLAPPSRHPSGRRYEWLCREPMIDAPSWLLELLKPTPRPAATFPVTPIAGACSAYGAAALDGETRDVAATGEGNRNNRLFAAAARLGGLVAGGELDEQLVRDRLLHAALASGLAQVESTLTINSGIRRGFETPRRAPERAA